jgi:hypothetical protein
MLSKNIINRIKNHNRKLKNLILEQKITELKNFKNILLNQKIKIFYYQNLKI